MELARISTVSDDEVKRARNLTALSVPSTFDGGGSTAATWAGLVELGITAARLQAYLDNTPRVDGVAVKAAAARVVQPAHSARVLVGDIAPIRAALNGSGPVVELTAAQLLPDLAAAQHALASE